MSSEDAWSAVKDADGAHLIAGDWRRAVTEIVAAFSHGDLAVTGLTSVTPVDPTTQRQIRAYLAEYGETLDELPAAAWGSSVAQWMGTHWEVLVDLWTKESGKSDLVLALRVFVEPPASYRIEVDSIHVP